MEDEKFIIDKILGIEVDQSKYINETNTLFTLSIGLINIYQVVKLKEELIKKENPGSTIYGNGPDIEKRLLMAPGEIHLFSCYFHWFANTVVNYCRLAGFLVAREKGEITEKDLQIDYDRDTIRTPVNDYINSIEDIKEVKKWRNKVSAHFAMTDPFAKTSKDGVEKDNIATLMDSVNNPVGFFQGRFTTNCMQIETLGAVSDLPLWSVTEVFEKLSDRYWQYFKAVQ